MRVVGQSGVVMDLPDHVATGLIDNGTVKVVDEAPESASSTVKAEGLPDGAQGGEGGGGVTGDAADPADGLPRGNASRDEWAAHALASGKTEDDLLGLTRDEIRQLFTDQGE